MRFTVIILVILMLSCSEEKGPYVFQHDDVIGKTFKGASHSIEFLTNESLVWEISYSRDTLVSYKINYNISGNDIQFEAMDTIREDYTDAMGGVGFVKTYYHDTFKGTFTDANTIDGYDERHFYNERPNDSYSGSTGGSELSILYRSVN